MTLPSVRITINLYKVLLAGGLCWLGFMKWYSTYLKKCTMLTSLQISTSIIYVHDRFFLVPNFYTFFINRSRSFTSFLQSEVHQCLQYRYDTAKSSLHRPISTHLPTLEGVGRTIKHRPTCLRPHYASYAPIAPRVRCTLLCAQSALFEWATIHCSAMEVRIPHVRYSVTLRASQVCLRAGLG